MQDVSEHLGGDNGGRKGECGSLTLPTSTSLVIITMLKQFSCHTILQKSYRVSCLGPSGRQEEITENKTGVSKPVLSIREVLLLWNLILLWPKCPFSDSRVLISQDCAVNIVIGNFKQKGRLDEWQNNSRSRLWKPRGPSVTHCHLRRRCFKKKKKQDHVGKKCSERQKHCWHVFFLSCKFHLSVTSLTGGIGRGSAGSR